jgi:hypothetical protein
MRTVTRLLTALLIAAASSSAIPAGAAPAGDAEIPAWSARPLPGGVLAVRLGRLEEGPVKAAYRTLSSTPHGNGVILDLRGALGEDAESAARVAEWFLSFEPRTTLLLLVDEATGGAAWRAVAALRRSDRARVAGRTLPRKGPETLIDVEVPPHLEDEIVDLGRSALVSVRNRAPAARYDTLARLLRESIAARPEIESDD